ncbi:response regulator [Lignipirellula cremea]|uniref:Transcriptional regulatory protein LiaR n=1 Tax=Lignipirellula cremea TaxID=2528010 RepID=A0A518E2J7_9BACT|nr:response regulator transcription factor [Lignipirellula cremea]QDU98317.1 Transcriptional regulatory protein LiaR [Lignipirellula cremea]
MTIQSARVVIVDDDIDIMRCVGACLEKSESIQVIDYASHAQSGLAMAVALRPDVVIHDIHMPGADAFWACRQIIDRTDGEVKVLFYTGFPSDHYVDLAMEAGAAGVVSKHSETLHGLAFAVRHVLTGDRYFSPELESRLVELESGQAKTRRSMLSRREIQVLKLMAEGQGNRQVSETLKLSLRLIEKIIAEMKKKLTLNSTNELLVYATREGLLQAELMLQRGR